MWRWVPVKVYGPDLLLWVHHVFSCLVSAVLFPGDGCVGCGAGKHCSVPGECCEKGTCCSTCGCQPGFASNKPDGCACLMCPSGKFADGTLCFVVVLDLNRCASGGVSQCQDAQCQPGYASPAGADDSTKKCTICSAGQFSIGGSGQCSETTCDPGL